MKQIVLFLLISAAVTAAIVGGYWWIQMSKPLEHGTSIVFEFDLPSDEVKKLEAKLGELDKLIARSSDETEKQALDESILRIRRELKSTKRAASEEASLALDMIEVLKDRIGARRVEWRPIGKNRLEVRIPPLRPETQKAKDAYLSAIKAVKSRNITKSDLRKLEKGETTVAKLAANDEELTALLDQFILYFKQTQTADETNRQQRISNWEVTEEQILQRGAWTVTLENILSRYVSDRDAAGLSKNPKTRAEVQRKRRANEAAVINFLREHRGRPERLKAIKNIIQRYIDWADMRWEMEDPSDVINLITRSGALEFRIAPVSSEAAGEFDKHMAIRAQQRDKYIKILFDTLEREGPMGLARRTDRYLWFPIRDRRKRGYGRVVTMSYSGANYILLSNYIGKTLLQSRGRDRWALSNAYMTSDSRESPAVGFSMNEAGAELLGELTQNNIGQHMAILLDGEVYSAPIIQAAISSSGIITMGTSDSREVSTLIEILRAGALPARINPEPVSITPF
jgi:hypothetical protein